MMQFWSVFGQMQLADGRVLTVIEGAHADDLPADVDAAKVDSAERVRTHFAELYDDPAARWLELRVIEAEGVPGNTVPPHVHASLFATPKNNDPGANECLELPF